MLKIGLIGCGYWGEKILNNLMILPSCEIVGVCDVSEKQVSYLSYKYKKTNFYKNINSILKKYPKALIIATPAKMHYQIAKQALKNNIHVLIEKPICLSSKKVKNLIYQAKKNKLKIMVDHPLLLSKTIKTIKYLIDDKKIGDLIYYRSFRENCNVTKSDINVLWDLAPHDLSILDYLYSYSNLYITKIKKYNISINNIIDKCSVNLNFANNIKANINLSWISKRKKRKIIIQGTKASIIWDATNEKNIIKIYKANKLKNNIVNKVYQDIQINENNEIISKLLSYFIEVIENKKDNFLDAKHGLKIIKIIEIIQSNINNLLVK